MLASIMLSYSLSCSKLRVCSLRLSDCDIDLDLSSSIVLRDSFTLDRLYWVI
jgi:hypothetical protein